MSDSIALIDERAVSSKPQDTWYSSNCGLPSALYFYFDNPKLIGWGDNEHAGVVGNCPAIQSIQYVPFLTPNDLTMFITKYDTDRFGNVETQRPGLTIFPNVHRIQSLNVKVKKLGTFKCYTQKPALGGLKNWRNEAKLHHYPFSFAMISDNLNTPIEIKYHLCKYTTCDIMVRNTISDRCSYGIYVEGYKGDVGGQLEAMVSGDAHELPCSSSTYSQWFATNKNVASQQTQAIIQRSFITRESSKKQELPNNIGTFQPKHLISSGASIISNNINAKTVQHQATKDIEQAIKSSLSQTRDIQSTPNTVISMGSDVYYGLEKGNKKLNLFRFGLTDEYYEKIGDYFAMYGYKLSKMSLPNIRSRYYYNYIKTLGINIRGYGIPREQMEKIRNIFDSGVTVWHIDNQGVDVGNYSMDNYEV
ncbi:MAG: hypothetical protein RR623_06455 [Bacilli bacterium]